MIGLFLVTHGSYGESLIQCACHVLNKRPLQLAQLGVSGQDDPLDLLPTARDWLQLVDSGEGVLLLTDIFGATPSNIALKLVQPGRVEAVTGVNLPMLLDFVNQKALPPEESAGRAAGKGAEAIRKG